MFLTCLRRELRRRARQASMIAAGLALGIGLVITVTALSSGVKNAQGQVLHSLYGAGTDITVTKAPSAGAGGPRAFGFRGRFGSGTRPAAGTKINIDNLNSFSLGTIGTAAVSSVVGVGLGFLGSSLVQHFSPPLTASVGQTTGSATPGGARTFGGGFGGWRAARLRPAAALARVE